MDGQSERLLIVEPQGLRVVVGSISEADLDTTAPLTRPGFFHSGVTQDAIQRDVRHHVHAQLEKVILPLLVGATVVYFVLRRYVDPLPMLAWYGVAVLDVLRVVLSNRDERNIAAAADTKASYIRRALPHYACFGLVWGSLPLIATRWGNDTGVWVALLVALVINGLAVLAAAPYRPLHLATIIGMMVPVSIAMVVRPEIGRAVGVIAAAYCVALIRLHGVAHANVLDATKAKHEKAELVEQLANYLSDRDPLTGLLNRRGLLAELAGYATANTPPAEVIIGVVNVKRFSAMNELLGVAGGDDLLVELGRRFGEIPGPLLAVARLDGDEFAIVAPHATSQDAGRLLSRLGNVSLHPIAAGGIDLDIALHVQHVVGPAADARNLLRAARAEQRRIRLTGRSVNVTLDSADPADHSSMVEELRAGLENGAVEPWFQPIVDARTGTVSAFEALVRWTHPTRGTIAPDSFLALADVAGLGYRLTQVVMARSVQFVQTMSQQGRDRVPVVHVNVSPSDLRRTQFIDDLRRELAAAGVPGNRIVLEITENDVILLDDTLAANLRRISDLGVQLAIDDFGTGYSSLSHLLELPIGHLKIDRRFIREFTTSPQQQALVRGVISIAEGLGLSTVAEGVETIEQIEQLRRFGCHHLQGFFVSPALPAERAAQFETCAIALDLQGALFNEFEITGQVPAIGRDVTELAV